MIHAKSGCIFAAFLKFLTAWLLIFPGMAARVLFPDEVACVEPDKCLKVCGSTSGCSNVAYIKLVMNLLPAGLRGLMLAAMMAALMSSLTSIFNSSSTIFTIDVWERIRRKSWKKMNPRSIEIEKLIIGRIFVLFLVGVSILWIPVIQNSSSSQLFIYIQSITSYLAPPICAVYLLAFFWKRTNEQGAFWGLMIGLVLGVIRFVMEFSYVIPPCGSDSPDPRPEIIKHLVGNVHFLHFRCILFIITLVVSVSVSFVTEPIPEKCLYRLTFATRFSSLPRTSVREWRNETEEPFLELAPVGQVTQLDVKTEIAGSNKWQLVHKMCGFSSAKEACKTWVPEKSRVELGKEAADYLKEDPCHARIVNGFAILTIATATFFWGFYA